MSYVWQHQQFAKRCHCRMNHDNVRIYPFVLPTRHKQHRHFHRLQNIYPRATLHHSLDRSEYSVGTCAYRIVLQIVDTVGKRLSIAACKQLGDKIDNKTGTIGRDNVAHSLPYLQFVLAICQCMGVNQAKPFEHIGILFGKSQCHISAH